MHLGICAQRLGAVRTGVARYLAGLLGEWATASLPFTQVTLFAPTALAAPARFGQANGAASLHPFLWEHLWLPQQARRLKIDLLFCPSYVLPLGWNGPAVVTIHDVIQEAMPKDFPLMARLTRAPLYRRSARRAALVLTDAQATVAAISHYYKVPTERIQAIPLAADARFHADSSHDDQAGLRARYGLGGDPFILFVGKLSRRRNLSALLTAFQQIAGQLPHRLVLVGVNHLRLPIAAQAAALGLSGRVIQTDFVPDADLAMLYRAADLFVYPSEMEGFGLPLIEALASGLPVVTLHRPVIVEVVGDAALTLAQASPALLAEAMLGLLTDRARHSALAQRGIVRAKRFSWTFTSQATMNQLARASGLPYTNYDQPSA